MDEIKRKKKLWNTFCAIIEYKPVLCKTIKDSIINNNVLLLFISIVDCVTINIYVNPQMPTNHNSKSNNNIIISKQ